jgi:hypothetical protein
MFHSWEEKILSCIRSWRWLAYNWKYPPIESLQSVNLAEQCQWIPPWLQKCCRGKRRQIKGNEHTSTSCWWVRKSCSLTRKTRNFRLLKRLQQKQRLLWLNLQQLIQSPLQCCLLEPMGASKSRVGHIQRQLDQNHFWICFCLSGVCKLCPFHWALRSRLGLQTEARNLFQSSWSEGFPKLGSKFFTDIPRFLPLLWGCRPWLNR